MINEYLSANSAEKWFGLTPVSTSTPARVTMFSDMVESSQFKELQAEKQELFKCMLYYFEYEVAVKVWECRDVPAEVLWLVAQGFFELRTNDFDAYLSTHVQCKFGLAKEYADKPSEFYDRLQEACSRMPYSTAKLLLGLFRVSAAVDVDIMLVGYHQGLIHFHPHAYLFYTAREVVAANGNLDEAYGNHQQLVNTAYMYHDYDDDVLYATYQETKTFYNRDASVLDLFELNKAANCAGHEQDDGRRPVYHYRELALSPSLFGSYYKMSARQAAEAAWAHTKNPVNYTAELERFALDLCPGFFEELIESIQAYCQIASSNFTRKEKAHVRLQLLKSSALFKAVKRDVKGLADFQMMYVFDQLCLRLASTPDLTVPLELKELSEEALEFRGWYDVAKRSSSFLRWFIADCRVSKETALEHSDLAKYLKGKSYEELVHLGTCDPYAARGGFSYQTFKTLCRNVEHFDKLEFTKKSDLAVLKSALNLCTLYGQDEAALLTKLRGESDACTTLKVHDLGLFEIRGTPVESLVKWRPFLLSNPELLKCANTKSLANAKDPVKGDSPNALREKLMATSYDNVPEELRPHIEHAFNNGWTQEIMNEFVFLAKSPKKDCLIPSVEYVHGRYKASLLPIGDPRALYIGELSGCCQHINEGAGNDAAVQSYQDNWCAVLVIENTQSKKLMAQSFLWLDKSEKAVVLDSVESVLDEDDEAVTEVVFPMLKGFAQEIRKRHDFSMYLAITDYGLTSKLRRIFSKHKGLDNSVCYPQTYQNKELGYSDAEDGCYMLKTVTAEGVSSLVSKLVPAK